MVKERKDIEESEKKNPSLNVLSHGKSDVIKKDKRTDDLKKKIRAFAAKDSKSLKELEEFFK